MKTAAYGHFGRSEPEFTWETTDAAVRLKDALAPALKAKGNGASQRKANGGSLIVARPLRLPRFGGATESA